MIAIAAACAFTAAVTAQQPCSFGYGCASMNFTVGHIKGNKWLEGGVGFEEYLMIPYAAARRFEAPSVTSTFAGGEFDATNILGDGSAACVQPGPPYMPNANVKQYGVENCLIMNLYKPEGAGDSKAPRPVLVWIFGGDNTASEIIPYNATKLAGQNNAIVVTVSYRLGVFGFAGFESDKQGTANWGMHDVLAAISFVKREHAALNADTSRIIVLGESSGATDSQILTMSPMARGLVSGSISESGGLYAQDLKEAIESTRKIGRAVGCGGESEDLKACMQKRSAASIAAQSGSYDWGPTVDSFFLMDEPRKLLAEGKLNPGVNVLWGGNTNDSATIFMLQEYVSKEHFIQQLNDTVHGGGGFPVAASGEGAAASSSQHRKKISGHKHLHRVLNQNAGRAQKLFATGDPKVKAAADDLLKRALALYPPKEPFKDPTHPLGNNALQVGWFSSDQFLCNAKREVLGASKALAASRGSAYLYEFNWLFQSHTSCVADSNYHDPESGSNHCDEMTFVMGQPIFDNQDAPGYSYTNCSDPHSKYYDAKRCVGCQFNALEQQFSSTITKFWTDFARGGEGLWEAFTPGKHAGAYFHPEEGSKGYSVEVDMGPRKEACLFWDDLDALYN